MAIGNAYPLFLNVAKHPVLVVGGGGVGLRKAKGLIACGARVTVVSLAFDVGFGDVTGVERIETGYTAAHMTDQPWRLVFAATDRPTVNAAVRRDAAAAGIWCCRCDEPDAGDFSGGATLRIGAAEGGGAKGGGRSVTVAVSTGGASPVLAGRICRQAAEGVDPVLVVFANLLSEWRPRVKSVLADVKTRAVLLRRMAGEEMERMVRQKGETAAQKIFETWMGEALAAGGRHASSSSKARKRGRAVKHAH